MDYVRRLQEQGILQTERQTVTRHLQEHGEDETQKMLVRLTNNNKERINTLEKEVSQLTQKLCEAINFIEKIKDKETVANARQAILRRKDNPPLDTPIDRNNVAPSQVQLENIFYAGTR